MVIGFTGSRRGMSLNQKASFWQTISERFPLEAFHHGDCLGADAEAHAQVALNAACTIYVHPPNDPSARAFSVGTPGSLTYVLEEKPYLARNHDVVDTCDLLVAAPEGAERLRSGTWATVRYARKVGKPIIVIWPNGERTYEGNVEAIS